MAKRRNFSDVAKNTVPFDGDMPRREMTFDADMEDAADESRRDRNDLPPDIAYVSSHPLFLKAVKGETDLSVSQRYLSGKWKPPSAQALTQLTWAIANPDKFMDNLMKMQVQAHRKISADQQTSSAEQHDDDLSDLDEALRLALAK